MSVQTFESHAHQNFVGRFLAVLGNVLAGIFAARAAQARFNELWYLSDAELAKLGLRRDTIAQEVMKAFDAR